MCLQLAFETWNAWHAAEACSPPFESSPNGNRTHACPGRCWLDALPMSYGRLKAGFYMTATIATIAAIAGRNVQ